jgi:hypothetical protein
MPDDFETAAKQVMAKFFKYSEADQKSILKYGGTVAMVAKARRKGVQLKKDENDDR